MNAVLAAALVALVLTGALTCGSADMLGFEDLSGWEVRFEDGATGTFELDSAVLRSGTHSLRVAKTNSLGYILIRTKQPVTMELGRRYSFRGYFHSEDAPVSSLLLFRLGNSESGDFPNPYGLYWYSAHGHVPNAPPGRWEKRIANYVCSADPTDGLGGARNVPPQTHANIILYGNPFTVWLDDVEVAPARTRPAGEEGLLSYPYSEEEAMRILASRPESTLRLESTPTKNRLVLNGEPVPPAMYMAKGTDERTGDFAGFGQAGVNLAIASDHVTGGVWLGKGKYNMASVDEAMVRVLRRNPRAEIVVGLYVYPYRGWVDENPDGAWSGERYPSYHSRAWRRDASDLVGAIAAHLSASPFAKAIVGFHIFSGIDGRMQLGGGDYSPDAITYFRVWLRDHYGSVERLNEAWGTSYPTFEGIPVPRSDSTALLGGHEADTPYLFQPAVNDYRSFRRADAWELVDVLAKRIKQEFRKPVLVACYRELEEDFLNCRYVDFVGNDLFYNFRRPGWATAGWHRVEMRGRGKMQFQDLDLRSFAGPQSEDEEEEVALGAMLTPEDWVSAHKKLVGISLAANAGYWYYEMWGFFRDPRILDEIGRVNKQVMTLAAAEPKPFRPDVALVLTGRVKDFETVYHNSVTGVIGFRGFNNDQEMAMETSGVPFDTWYLDDILARPELQNYKVYLFVHNTYITAAQRRGIDEKLKRGGRTLVWVYDTGYIGERGPDVQGMAELIGIGVRTEEKFERLMPLADPAGIVPGIRPFQGMAELTYANFRLHGLDGLNACGQPFWIDDHRAEGFGTYRENGRTAMAVRRYPGWTSIYLAAPDSLGDDLLNNLARMAGAYVCGEAGQSVDMNGQFISLHGMKSGPYTFHLPAGIKSVRDMDTN